MEPKEIRRKIGSVNNIRKLTSALETLSALKMKKAQKAALLSRPFAFKVTELLSKLEPVPEQRKIKKILVGVLASDRGFCGSFNQNVLKLADEEIKKIEKEGPVEIFPIGKKSAAFFKKKGYEIGINFSGIGDYATLEEIKPISDFLIKSFEEDKFQKVYFIWTHFYSTFSQKPQAVQLLPFVKENFPEVLAGQSAAPSDFLIEPSADYLLREIIPQLIEYILYQSILDSNAAEHSSRMVAMRNASDNARKKAEELKLEYNKARQEQITSEVLEISTTKEVLSK